MSLNSRALHRTLKSTAATTVVGALLLFGAVAPAQAAPAAPAAAAVKTATSATETAVARILADTNSARKARGLKPLTLSKSMSTVAQNWSAAQYKARKMSHNPHYTSQIPAGWRAAAENVAMGYSYTKVTSAWMNSTGHRANILNKSFTHIGIGYVNSPTGAYYTQVFAGYPSTRQPDTPVAPSVTPGYTVGRVEWKAPSANGSAIVKYQVSYYNTKTQRTSTVISGDTSKQLSGLSAGTSYRVSVRAYNAKGWSTKSGSTTLTTKAATVPAVVSTSTSTTESTAKVSISANGYGSTVRAYALAVDGEILTATTSTLTAKALDSGSSYTAKVSAKNGKGWSAWKTITVTTK